MAVEPEQPAEHFRDRGPYSARSTSKGALVKEASRIFEQLSAGSSLADVRRRVLVGSILPQRSRNTRRHIWTAINRRYISRTPSWIVDDLTGAARKGAHNAELVSLLYLHFAFRDSLIYHFVTEAIWVRWLQNRVQVSREDVLSFLDEASKDQPQIQNWSNSSRLKLAGNVLSALRDFGVLQGVQRKVIVKPDLPVGAAEHLVRILTAQGLKGAQVIHSTYWRLFLRTEEEVADLLRRLSQKSGIRFERIGSAVLLETPNAWSERP